MNTRRKFIKSAGSLLAGTFLLPYFADGAKNKKNIGIQLYTVRNEMLEDPIATLKFLSKIGYNEVESARSEKGNYYGFKPAEIKKITNDLGMKLKSGHVHIDDSWQRSIDEAAEAGQEYLICSSLPSEGQTIDNYKKVATIFMKAAEDCKKSGITFGYHNHDYEFEKIGNQVLYDILLEETDPELVVMELDLGWVVVTGNDPVAYFEKYKGRFPLWHLKDMNLHQESTEFGKGQVNIPRMMQFAETSGLKHFFVEQEEYSVSPKESIRHNYNYMMRLRYKEPNTY